VMEVVASVGRALREDPLLGPLTTENLEILGVDQFADSAVVIKARIRTLPAKQWTISRAFNRRLKLAFEANGIEFPYPQRTVHIVDSRVRDSSVIAPSTGLKPAAL